MLISDCEALVVFLLYCEIQLWKNNPWG